MLSGFTFLKLQKKASLLTDFPGIMWSRLAVPISQMGKQRPSMMGAELGSEPESVQLVLRPCSCSSGQLGP